jgi:hypothetical protein
MSGWRGRRRHGAASQPGRGARRWPRLNFTERPAVFCDHLTFPRTMSDSGTDAAELVRRAFKRTPVVGGVAGDVPASCQPARSASGGVTRFIGGASRRPNGLRLRGAGVPPVCRRRPPPRRGSRRQLLSVIRHPSRFLRANGVVDLLLDVAAVLAARLFFGVGEEPERNANHALRELHVQPRPTDGTPSLTPTPSRPCTQ